MLLARQWPPNVQPIVIGVVAAYATMWLAMVARARKPEYGRGIAVVHALWIELMSPKPK